MIAGIKTQLPLYNNMPGYKNFHSHVASSHSHLASSPVHGYMPVKNGRCNGSVGSGSTASSRPSNGPYGFVPDGVASVAARLFK